MLLGERKMAEGARGGLQRVLESLVSFTCLPRRQCFIVAWSFENGDFRGLGWLHKRDAAWVEGSRILNLRVLRSKNYIEFIVKTV